MSSKRCARCKDAKPLSEFYLNKDGTPRAYCKKCWCAYSTEHQKKNREKYKDRVRRYEDVNKEHIQAVRNKWYANNRELMRAAWARYRAKKRAERDAVLAHIPSATHKWCSQCNEIKMLSEFNAANHRKSGLSSKCKPCSRDNQKQWVGANPVKSLESQRRYISTHRAKVNANNKARKIRRRKIALPKWADKAAILAMYSEAARLSKETGIQHDVDHVIPINGNAVCGLHVETNLRVIPKAQNVRKSNKHLEA